MTPGLSHAGAVETAAPPFMAFVADDVTREIVRQAAVRLGLAPSAVGAGGLESSIAALRAGPCPALLIVDTSGCGDVLAAMEGLAEVCEPGVRVVALGMENDIGLYRTLLQIGVADYLTKPLTVEAMAAAMGAAPAEPPQPRARTKGRSIAVLGARGGVGATSLAVSLSWELAQTHQQRTLLLDLDLQFGAAALCLDVEPGRGLADILSAPDRVDSLLVGSAAAHVGERLGVLAAEEDLDAEVRLDGRGLDALLGAVADTTDAVVVDLPRALGPLGRAALARAETTVIVTDLSLAGLRDTRRLLAFVRSVQPAGGRVLAVGSKIGASSGEVPRAEFERALGAPLDAGVAFDPKMAALAAEQARPLVATAADGPAVKEIRRLAAVVAGAPEVRPTSWLTRLLRRH